MKLSRFLALRHFSKSFLMSPRSPSKFYDILKQNGCLKITKGFPFRCFGTMRVQNSHISKIFKYPPSIFFIFCTRTDVEKSRTVPLKQFSALLDCKILIFCLILSFLNRYPPMIFFNTIRILEVEVREDGAVSEFLTLYPNYIEFY